MKNTKNIKERVTKSFTEKIAGRERIFNYCGDKLISVTTPENGKSVRICKNKYKTLFTVSGVKFKIPSQSLNSKIVGEQTLFTVESKGIVEYLSPAYFRAGIFLKRDDNNSVLLTRNFFARNGNPYSLPFGKTVTGDIEVQECTMHNGKKKVIINYIVNKIYDHNRDKEEGWKEIKITTTPPDDKIFQKIKIEPSNYFIIIK